MTKSTVNHLKVNFKKLDPAAKLPEYKTAGAVGADLSSLKAYLLKPGEVTFIGTGISIEIPEGLMGILAPRGSLCLKNGLHMPHSLGIIDWDYRGELIVPLRNAGTESVEILAGERVAQFILVPVFKAEFQEVTDLSETERAAGGFGSTGLI